MAGVSTYLNFNGTTEEAFTFYKSVFGTEFIGIMRHGDVPPHEGQSDLSEAEKNLIINVQLPILGGHLLMGTDFTESMGGEYIQGNNVEISLHTDSRGEADTLHAALAEGGTVAMPMADQFWGDYFGAVIDRFGIRWMVSHSGNA